MILSIAPPLLPLSVLLICKRFALHRKRAYKELLELTT
uniref:Uncharacterized protein n=1 Tax=Arundo donax TaxID=35708 RepID=A0A0A9HLJ4_ARUDO